MITIHINKTDIPTEPGWYLVKRPTAPRPELVEIRLNKLTDTTSELTFIGHSSCFPLSNISREKEILKDQTQWSARLSWSVTS